jgi:hypothetical protein
MRKPLDDSKTPYDIVRHLPKPTEPSQPNDRELRGSIPFSRMAIDSSGPDALDLGEDRDKEKTWRREDAKRRADESGLDVLIRIWNMSLGSLGGRGRVVGQCNVEGTCWIQESGI